MDRAKRRDLRPPDVLPAHPQPSRSALDVHSSWNAAVAEAAMTLAAIQNLDTDEIGLIVLIVAVGIVFVLSVLRKRA
jgi:hypothetical protein